MKICMIGSGYVGLVSGACFAELGNNVICLDKNLNKISNLKNGVIPIYEPGLEELIQRNVKQKRLQFSTNISKSIIKSDIIFICVGTPTKIKSNEADLKYVFQVVRDIKKNLNKYKIIVTKSTVPVTTGDKIQNLLTTKNNKKLFDVVSNPEFLREAYAKDDFINSEFVLLGGRKSLCQNVKDFYEEHTKCKTSNFLLTDIVTALFAKYTINTFLASKVIFFNELFEVFQKSDSSESWEYFTKINLCFY